MREPDAYECDHCGARFEPGEFYSYCNRDDDGNWEFRCSCGCTDYTELYECKCCHDLHSPYKNKRIQWWRVCDECCRRAIEEFNEALSHIIDDHREILQEVYDIEPIKEV